MSTAMYISPLRRIAGGEAKAPGLWLALEAHVIIRVSMLGTLYVAGMLNNSSAYHALTGWDAGWYRLIAEQGYGHVQVASDGRQLSDYAFFPLYPFAERAVSALTGLSAVQAGLAISAVSSLLAAAGIYRVGAHLHDARTGVVLVCLWSSLPVSIVQSMAYSESLFTAIVAWSLYALLAQRYVVAGSFAALAGLTRPMGAAVVAAVVGAALLGMVQLRRRRRPRVQADHHPGGAILGALLAPVGLVAYLAFVGWTQGRIFGYLDVANRWGNGLDGGQAFSAWILHMLDRSHTFPLAAAVLLGLALLGAAVGHTASGKYPWPIFAFTLTAVLISFSTSDYFGSKPRYLLPVFTLLLWPSERLARLPNVPVVLVLSSLAAASGGYGAVWLFGPGPP